MKVKKAMTRDVKCCIPSETITEVARMMRTNDVGAIPVIKDKTSKQLVGIVTDRDICCRALTSKKASGKTRIEEVMTPKPVVCHEEDTLDDCAHLMQKYRIRRLPVADESGACVGIIAQGDIARHLEAAKVGRTVAWISKPSRVRHVSRAAA